jgi:apolipoprotein N-acyltransferase
MRARLALAVISALLLGAAFPPVGLSPLSWIALVPLFWALESQAEADRERTGFKRIRRPFIVGLLFGFIFFLSTLYWVVYSMYVYGGVPFALSLLFMLLLVLILAIYPAIFAILFTLTRGRGAILRLFLVPSAWVGLEYLRELLFTGFPWALTGYTQARAVPIIQIADIFGVYGISFLVVLVNFAIHAYLFNKKDVGSEGIFGSGRLAKKAAVLAALVLLTSTLAYGFIKIKVVDARLLGSQELKVAVAQGNIDQSLKWNPEFRLKTIDIYRELSLKSAQENAKLIIWPESAVPFYLYYEFKDARRVRDVAIETGAYLLTGSPHFEDNEFGSSEWERYFNSAFLLDPKGEIAGRYDKVKLVPFGEYIPLKRALFFLKKLTEGYADFTPGPGHKPLEMKGAKVGVLICFESIFPGISSAAVTGGASFLVVLTNDGWFGKTSAAYQHFDMAILRAVENRVSVVRAANRGISGVIDPLGRVDSETGLLSRESFVAGVKLKRAGEPKSFFTLYGRRFPILLILFFVFSFFINKDRR